MKSKKLIISVSLLFLSTLLLAYIVYKADLSLQPLRPGTLEDKNARLPVYMISYADGHEVFYKNQHMLTYSAQNKGFDFFLSYRKSLLNPEFVKKNQDIFSIKSGAGLWIWKPQIILQTMDLAPEGALIVYTDVGFIYGKDAKELLALLGDNHALLEHIHNYEAENKLTEWLPKKIAQEWDILDNPPPLIESGFIIVRNTKQARVVIEKWLELCLRRDYAFSSYDSAQDNIKGFSYDQSLLSLAAYRYPEGVKLISKSELMPFVLFPHRHPGCNLPVLLAYAIPLPIAKGIVYVIRKFRAFYRLITE